MRFFPVAFLQMDDTLPAVPGAPRSRAEASWHSRALSNPEEGVRMLPRGERSHGVPVLPLCDPPSGAQIAVSEAVRGLPWAWQSAGFYCQVVLNQVVPRAVCWWPHEIAVAS